MNSAQRARELRRNATDAERILWSRVRDRRLDGRKFRRQYPIGPYIADFACPQERLVVELDGGAHADHADYDADRTRFLEADGYRVLRYWNTDVLKNLAGALESIRATWAPNADAPPTGFPPTREPTPHRPSFPRRLAAEARLLALVAFDHAPLAMGRDRGAQRLVSKSPGARALPAKAGTSWSL